MEAPVYIMGNHTVERWYERTGDDSSPDLIKYKIARTISCGEVILEFPDFQFVRTGNFIFPCGASSRHPNSFIVTTILDATKKEIHLSYRGNLVAIIPAADANRRKYPRIRRLNKWQIQNIELFDRIAEKGWTLREFADRVGLSLRMVERYIFQGATPRPDTKKRIEAVLL